jgi:hypothetical protein
MDDFIPSLWASRAEDGDEHEDQAMKPDDGVVPGRSARGRRKAVARVAAGHTGD